MAEIRPLRRYRHRCGKRYYCLHCKLGRVVTFHEWVGKVSPARRKAMIIRDLKLVLAEVRKRL